MNPAKVASRADFHTVENYYTVDGGCATASGKANATEPKLAVVAIARDGLGLAGWHPSFSRRKEDRR